MNGNSLAGAGKAEAFLRSRLHTDKIFGNLQNPCDFLPHQRNMRLQFRGLCQNGSVHVGYGKALGADQHTNLPQKFQTVSTLVTGIGIREMLTNVTQRSGTEQCIRYSMQQYIRIGMTEQTLIIRNINAADNQFSVSVSL